MKALPLIQLCAREYNDTGYVRIKKVASVNEPNWLDWLNDAQRTVALVRPDASAVTENITLVAGPKQSLPSGRIRLLAAIRNMGADGATPGRALTVVPREDQDAVNPDWYSASNASPVSAVIYDDKKDPTTFWVTPPAVANWRIEATMSRTPADVTDADAGDISLSDVYATPIQHWMMFRAYLLHVQASGNLARASGYFSSFFQLLGVKIKAELWMAAQAAPHLARPPAQGAAA